MNFINAMQTNDIRGENNMPTNSTSGNALVDLFYRLGATRKDDEQTILKYFLNAFYNNSPEDAHNALKALFYARDIREGQGERRFFRIILKHLAENNPATISNNIHNIPFYGRWDDLFTIIDSDCMPTLKSKVADYILFALSSKDDRKLCAKWMPRENKKRGDLAKFLMNEWKMSPKTYRQLLAGNTEVVESVMCKNDWANIKYESVPSVAMHKYRKAFFKHDLDRMTEFVGKAIKGEVKINSSVLYPYQIIHPIIPSVRTAATTPFAYTLNVNHVGEIYRHAQQQDVDFAQAQWNHLPNYVPEGKNFLPIVDVSGSMNGQPLEVAVALGLYLSERNIGPFKDAFITFSSEPKLQVLTGNLYERLCQIVTSGWNMNTDLDKVFQLVLEKAVANELPQEDMPQTLIILSDMQFDECVLNGDLSALQMIKRRYTNAGYNMPRIVFWNLRNAFGVPAKSDKEDTTLVSGFSPSIMKEVLEAKTPLELVLATLNSERYNRVTL